MLSILSSALLSKLPYHSRNAVVATFILPRRLFSSGGDGGLLPFREKPYSSIEIDVTDDICTDSSDFAVKLWTTIGFAKNSNKKSILLNFNVQQANYMPIANLYGFKFHQAEGDYARMALWLGEGESKIPIFASHHAGVAGVVAREGQLLVVKEKHKQLGWKFPGGYVNLGEELDVAAMREVLEETGIKTRYSGLLGFRHSHNILYGRGDLYFICKLEALSHEIVVDDEVEDAQWMDIKEFRAQNKNPLLKEIVDIIEFQSPPMEEQRLNSIMSTRKPFLFYSMSQTNKPK